MWRPTEAASNTLRTRMAYHWLESVGRLDIYADYLNGQVGRQELYAAVPPRVVQSVIQREIRPNTLGPIYREIDALLAGRSLDLVVGGPPCQAYSVVGRSRDPNGMVEDQRNYLYRCYAKFLERYRPKRFVFENVTGLLSAKNRNGQRHFDAMRSVFHRLGYETQFSTLAARDYGVLQNRKRVVLVGHPVGAPCPYPEPERWTPRTTVGDVLKGLPAIGAGEGHPGPCRRRRNTGRWQIESGVRSDLPVTWHQAAAAHSPRPRDLSNRREPVERAEGPAALRNVTHPSENAPEPGVLRRQIQGGRGRLAVRTDGSSPHLQGWPLLHPPGHRTKPLPDAARSSSPANIPRRLLLRGCQWFAVADPCVPPDRQRRTGASFAAGCRCPEGRLGLTSRTVVVWPWANSSVVRVRVEPSVQ